MAQTASRQVTTPTARVATNTPSGSFDVIKRSHGLSGDVRELDEFYRDWAATYDADVSDQNYTGPTILVGLALEAVDHAGLAPDSLQVLDAGCGTGLVGVQLQWAGVPAVDGIDLSEAMVERARETGIYRSLRGGIDLNLPVECVESGSYDLVLCCGVFTTGHVTTKALDHLLDTARPGGVLVISTRLSYLRDSGFEERVRQLTATGAVRLLRTVREGSYIDKEGAAYWVLQKE